MVQTSEDSRLPEVSYLCRLSDWGEQETVLNTVLYIRKNSLDGFFCQSGIAFQDLIFGPSLGQKSYDVLNGNPCPLDSGLAQ